VSVTERLRGWNGAGTRELAGSPELPLLRLLRWSGLSTWVFGMLWGVLLFAVMMTPFAALTDMRERVVQAPGWPLDLAGIPGILLYIVLPPLTWAAAALVEMFIGGLV